VVVKRISWLRNTLLTSRAWIQCVNLHSCHEPLVDDRGQRKDELEYWLTEHLRLNGVYWGLTALYLLGHPRALPRDEIVRFVLSCQSENGGFGAAPRHDAHMLSTVSAVQILATVDALDELDGQVNGGREKVGKCK
jgi:geranylgeranyl transferase type-2 subunit beta